MIKILVVMATLLARPAAAIEPGLYRLTFQSAPDNFLVQDIEIRNVRRKNRSSASFDVKIDNEGGLKRFPEDSQLVQGICYGGKFSFVVGFPSGTEVLSFTFIGVDGESHDKLEGKAYLTSHYGVPKDYTGNFHMEHLKTTDAR